MNPTQRQLDSQAAQDFLAANPRAHRVHVGTVRRDRSGNENYGAEAWVVHDDLPRSREDADRELAEAGENVERMIVLAAVAFVLLLAGAIASRFPQLLAALGV